MERSVEVDTGESVAFSYELAGLGSRFLAVFVDMTLQLVGAVVLFGAVGVVFAVLGPVRQSALVDAAGSLLMAAGIFTVFMIFFGYFIFFEWRWNGRTPGKRLLGLRVVRDGGFPVDFIASAIRNLLRIVEFGFGFYAVSAICMLLSPQNRRLGDLAAGTIVVRDARYERGAPIAGGFAGDPLLRDVSSRDRELVHRYLERRSALDGRSRREVAAEIAGRVRPRLPARFDHLEDDALLEHLARAERLD